MANRFFEVNKISFTDDGFPGEGAGHNRALHLIVKCEGHYVKRVIVDGGSSIDVCPLSTLQSMKINTDRIRPSNVCIQAFGGSATYTIVEIHLTMTIGSIDFDIVFHVVDMETSYSFLLGRPWIHMARAVPSTLHQMVKFKHDMQEIIIHGEDESPIYRDSLIPCIEAKEGCESIVYQAFKVVVVDHVEEGKPILHPRLSTISVMVVALMLRQGYEPGKGLGASLQGISEPISPFSKKGTFGLGFRPRQADEDKAKHHKKHGWRDVFAWSYDDMSGLSAVLVVHKLPMYSDFPPVQQKQQKFKTNMSDKIKEEIIKQSSANVVRAARYTTWVENLVHVPKKDGKTRVCVDYRDLNKASPKDSFPLPNIHILLDNCAKHEIQSFMDCYAGYHHILMDEDDIENIAFTTPWGTYCYRVMPFGLNYAGTTYMRDMTTIFHDMMHKEIEVYVDDVIIKSKTRVDHVRDLKKFFE
ncbi:uncharacterized protein [Nicotiana tomentosiformis]|uniref:uncharacterized protein n=1 Tax=Nicotiana tomentosiformis TaxID=4098 RepID=UPI00388C664C